MYIIWKKLQRLQHVIKNISKSYGGITQQLEKAREDLYASQTNLLQDRMNIQLIDRVKDCNNEVLSLSNIEEKLLKKKSKVEWLRLGDGNNSHFHASLKSKRRQTQIANLKDEAGNILYQQKDIEQEIIKYYNKLIGTANRNLTRIDIVAMRGGPQLSFEQRDSLIAFIIEKRKFY